MKNKHAEIHPELYPISLSLTLSLCLTHKRTHTHLCESISDSHKHRRALQELRGAALSLLRGIRNVLAAEIARFLLERNNLLLRFHVRSCIFFSVFLTWCEVLGCENQDRGVLHRRDSGYRSLVNDDEFL